MGKKPKASTMPLAKISTNNSQVYSSKQNTNNYAHTQKRSSYLSSNENNFITSAQSEKINNEKSIKATKKERNIYIDNAFVF